ncbi:MAG: hemophore-related protein [Mycobacterium sp.]
MTIASWVKISLAVTVALVATPGSAAAAPGEGPLISTTCSYQQLGSALQVEAPDLASRLAGNPQMQSRIIDLLALPVDQRKQRVQGFLDRNPDVKRMVDAKWGTPEGQQKVAAAEAVANTCHNY